MKKMSVLVLLIAFVLSLAAPAFAAVGSPEGNLKPEVISSTCDKFAMTTLDEMDRLTPAQRETFLRARAFLGNAMTDEMLVRYFFYADICELCLAADAEFVVEDDYMEYVVMEYIDGEWVRLEVDVIEDSHLLVRGIVDGPIVFMTHERPSDVESSCGSFAMYNAEELQSQPKALQDTFEESKKLLSETVPDEMAVRYLFHADICEQCVEEEVTLKLEDITEYVVIQYVNQQWVALEVTYNNDGTITVHGVVDGPIAFMIYNKPVIISSVPEAFSIWSAAIPEDQAEAYDAAREALTEAVPEDMLVRNLLCCVTAEPANVEFQAADYGELVIMQYLNGKWEAVEFTADEEAGTIVVEGIAAAPTVFFAK